MEWGIMTSRNSPQEAKKGPSLGQKSNLPRRWPWWSAWLKLDGVGQAVGE